MLMVAKKPATCRLSHLNVHEIELRSRQQSWHVSRTKSTLASGPQPRHPCELIVKVFGQTAADAIPESADWTNAQRGWQHKHAWAGLLETSLRRLGQQMGGQPNQCMNLSQDL